MKFLSLIALAPLALSQKTDANDCTYLRTAFISMGGNSAVAPAFSGCCALSGFWTCTNNRITEVNFNELELKGEIHPLVSKLDQVVSLNFYGNLLSNFASTFNFTNLQKLERLYVSYNIFSQVPSGIQNLKSLKELEFNDNGITTTFPSAVASLPNLEYFGAAGNRINGPIPPFASTKLTRCYLLGNTNLCKNSSSPAVCSYSRLRKC